MATASASTGCEDDGLPSSHAGDAPTAGGPERRRLRRHGNALDRRGGDVDDNLAKSLHEFDGISTKVVVSWGNKVCIGVASGLNDIVQNI